jgi:hypothetical protein
MSIRSASAIDEWRPSEPDHSKSLKSDHWTFGIGPFLPVKDLVALSQTKEAIRSDLSRGKALLIQINDQLKRNPCFVLTSKMIQVILHDPVCRGLVDLPRNIRSMRLNGDALNARLPEIFAACPHLKFVEFVNTSLPLRVPRFAPIGCTCTFREES